MSERTLYESPRLWSWFSAANWDTVNTFIDKSSRNHNWVQPSGTNLPSEDSNWFKLGLKARKFDGTDDFISADHFAPMGAFSCVVLGDMDVGWSSGDNLTRPFLAGVNGTGTTQIFSFHGINRKIQISSQGTSTAQSGLVTLGSPTVFTFVVDPINKELACRINGGSWVSVAMPVAAIPIRKEYQLGARLGNGATRAGFFRSTIVESMIFDCSLKDSRYSTLLTDAENTLFELANSTTGFMSVNTQPSTTATSNVNLAVQPRFNVLTSAGITDTSYNGPVTIEAVGAGTLSGTLTVNASSGVVIYSGIKIIGAGVTQILAHVNNKGRVLTNNITVS